MPQFIKMGLGGTGYAGKPGNALRQARRRATRRKVLAGYPVDKPFSSDKEVREYLSGDRIICLLCGKSYKNLGSVHLQKIHGISEDEYKSKYHIPWSYGLCCQELVKKFSDNLHQRLDDGTVKPLSPTEMREVRYLTLRTKKPRKEWFLAEHAKKMYSNAPRGVSRPIHPLTINPETGLLETFTAKRERLTTKRGTPEHREKMANRPQVKKNIEILKQYWVGKKQSKEHKEKRIKNMMETRGLPVKILTPETDTEKTNSIDTQN